MSSEGFTAFAGGLVELIGGRPAGLGVAVGSAGCSLGGSFGAVRTFHSGLAFGACLPRDAETLMKSWSKKMSNEMLGIGIIVLLDQSGNTCCEFEDADVDIGKIDAIRVHGDLLLLNEELLLPTSIHC